MENTLQIIETNGIQTVSARELYKGLEISKRFSEWWKSNSKDFTENEDFHGVYLKVQGNQYGGEQEIQDYAISIDMAKAICLMSKTEIGKKYRTYLINLEKAWNEPGAVMARALEIAHKTLEDCQKQVAIMQPKADVYDQLVDRSKCINFRDFATKIGFTQNEFMTILKSKYIYKNSVGEYRAYSEYQKYFTLRTFSKGVDKTGEQLMLNMDGITYFTEKYKPSAIAESFIEKSKKEYQKIMDETAGNYLERAIKNCPECNHTIVDLSESFSIQQVAKIIEEPEETVLNFIAAKGWIDPETKKPLLPLKYIDSNGRITVDGKDKIVSAFYTIKKTEKGMKAFGCGKGE